MILVPLALAFQIALCLRRREYICHDLPPPDQDRYVFLSDRLSVPSNPHIPMGRVIVKRGGGKRNSGGADLRNRN
ncbi:hypothetical protein PISMIDRAFT_200781 [Pisolithus microcarpus 441]|uniref:Secreted protein n=1 Tax=Pisolithus microcarpus 441 TaxID=765257 RepID=A0A0C9ZY76_9AGAM|nr:hypothetical protein BKA83DRAFT_200781 [Pisolithus microcarpus]KIK27167.1 hypothetical protein PISMIDRAFT_200781 [Pisolithus microcarpus 441]